MRDRAGSLGERLLVAAMAVCSFLTVPDELEGQLQTYYVSPLGNDAFPGNFLLPFRTIQKAVDVVGPGDTILIQPGIYQEQVRIRRSGAAGKPIVMRPAVQDQPWTVTVAATLAERLCSERSPAEQRTLMLTEGQDQWIIRDLVISGGVLISGTNPNTLAEAVRDRSLPGRGYYDPAGAKTTLTVLKRDGADYIQLLNNKITNRGIWARVARYGLVQGNEVHDIDCGTGPGIWLSTFSDGWTIRSNRVYTFEASAVHWNSEGIRVGSASNYNLVELNYVSDIPNPGRGVNTDVNASWNVIRRNYVARTQQGFTEQTGGWGNQWLYNVSEQNRGTGFAVGAHLPFFKVYDYRHWWTPAYIKMQCNQSKNDLRALTIGGVRNSTFAKNKFAVVLVAQNVRNYWAEAKNTWDGKYVAPPLNPSTASFASC
jgi:hypothetical protein